MSTTTRPRSAAGSPRRIRTACRPDEGSAMPTNSPWRRRWCATSAAQRTEIDGKRSRCSPACGRSSATAMWRRSARRCGMRATRCRPTGRTTSRRWRMRRSRSPRRRGRRRMMACTSSIGPGATNMVTAAAVAHVNRLPVLLLPGDVFANRRPDPVLQQVEDFARRHGLGERLLPPGVALFRPHHAARADHRGAAARHERADRSGRHAGR